MYSQDFNFKQKFYGVLYHLYNNYIHGQIWFLYTKWRSTILDNFRNAISELFQVCI